MIYARTKNHNPGNAFFKNKGYGNTFFKNKSYSIPFPDKSKQQTPVIADHLSEQINNHETALNNIIAQKIPADVKACAITKTLKNFKNLDRARKNKAGAVFQVTKKIPKRPRQGRREPRQRRDASPINIYEPEDLHIRHLYDGYEVEPPPPPPPAPRPPPDAQAVALNKLKIQVKQLTPEKRQQLAKFKKDITPEKIKTTPKRKKREQRKSNLFSSDKKDRKTYGRGLMKKFKPIKWYHAPSSSLQWI